jgi:F-type H+-transporting ATPase subunit b
MELVKPAIGLVFWMVITFGALFFILAKFAWKPILGMLDEREKTIADSLDQANKARAEMAALTSKNLDLLNQAKEERNMILHEAKEAADKLKNEMLAKAQQEVEAKIQTAFREIEIQKRAAITEVKNSVGLLALDIAEKVIRKDLKGNAEQLEYVNKLAKESNLN